MSFQKSCFLLDMAIDNLNVVVARRQKRFGLGRGIEDFSVPWEIRIM
jgi:hypothetical protein